MHVTVHLHFQQSNSIQGDFLGSEDLTEKYMCVYVCLHGTYITFFFSDPVFNYMGGPSDDYYQTHFCIVTLLCMIREGQSK